MTVTAALAVAAALPAAVFARFGPWPARCAGVAAVGLVAWVLVQPPRPRAEHQVHDPVLVTTGAVPAAVDESAVSSVVDSGPQRARGARSGAPSPASEPRAVRIAAGEGEPAPVLVAEYLRSGGDAPVALVWTGPFDADASTMRGIADVSTTRPPPRVDAEALELGVDGLPERGRPMRLHFWIRPPAVGGAPAASGQAPRALAAALPGGFGATIRVLEGGTEVARAAASTRQLRAGSIELVHVPHLDSIEVEVEVLDSERDQRWLGRAELPVAAPRPVLVVGPAAPGLVEALTVQGIEAVASPELPAAEDSGVRADAASDLAAVRAAAIGRLDGHRDFGVVVLTARPSVEDQVRLVAFTAAGGGVLCVGDAAGGGLPLPSEPFAAWLPVRYRPGPPPSPGTAGPEGDSTVGDGGAEGARDRAALEDAGQPRTEAEQKPESEPKSDTEQKPAADGQRSGSEDQSPPAGQSAPEQPKGAEPPPQAPIVDASPPDDAVEDPQPARGDTSGARIGSGREVEVERRLVAMVLVVDRSGSMSELAGGYTKMDLAKRSALDTAKALRPGDRLGVISFGVTGAEVCGLTDAADIARIESRLETLRATDRATFVAQRTRARGRHARRVGRRGAAHRGDLRRGHLRCRRERSLGGALRRLRARTADHVECDPGRSAAQHDLDSEDGRTRRRQVLPRVGSRFAAARRQRRGRVHAAPRRSPAATPAGSRRCRVGGR